MPQLGLFESGPRVLFDDALGRVTYQPNVIDAQRARDWFDALRREVPWRSERRQMYDREVDVPRLMASYRLDGALPAALAAAREVVEAATQVRYDSVGLNLYRDGRDSVAPHNDHIDELAVGAPIALLSLGATREMVIRAKQPPRRVARIELEAGSLLLMSFESQRHYDHGIPKLDATVGERISLAFRVHPQGPRGRYGWAKSAESVRSN